MIGGYMLYAEYGVPIFIGWDVVMHHCAAVVTI